MQVSVKHVSPAGFLFVLFCFVLPFVTLSCPAGQFTFTGVQLATGTTIEEPQMFGQAKQRKIDGEPLALFALLVALIGGGLAFLAGRTTRLAAAGLGGLGAILLLMLKSKIASDAVKEGGGMFQVSFGAGYWLALVGFIAAAGLNLYVASKLQVSGNPEREHSPDPARAGSEP